jgi:hypothetical protein
MLRAERLVRNQALARYANEEVRRAAATLTDPSDEPEPTFEFLCECTRRDCRTMVPLTLREYEVVRADSATFVLAPGHEIDKIERVTQRQPRFYVVRKIHPEPISAAADLDPRREPPQDAA